MKRAGLQRAGAGKCEPAEYHFQRTQAERKRGHAKKEDKERDEMHAMESWQRFVPTRFLA